MKRFFENPELELLKFAVADVITASTEEDDEDEEGPPPPSTTCVG